MGSNLEGFWDWIANILNNYKFCGFNNKNGTLAEG